MCGIAGIFGESPDSSRSRVEAMLDTMAHRGPDGRGVMEFAGGAAGMVRLALVDLSPQGQQPLWSADGRAAILFNGEAYNFRQERSRLEGQGHRFRTQTDAEVVLALYLERGLDFFERLRGMYALALFDWRESGAASPPTVVLGRDPFGMKPLYLWESPGGRRVFGSEIKGMLASGLVEPEVDRLGLASYLTRGFVVQPRTIIRDVRMLEAGTWLRWGADGRTASGRFWELPTDGVQPGSLDEHAERLAAAIEESVALHAFADARVGAFLSGGVDSTGLVGLMARHVGRLRTFTLTFPDLPFGDEAGEAARCAGEFGCDHTTVEVSGRDVAGSIERFSSDLDQPSTDGLNTWLISRAAGPEVKGVLSGLGGDEWFAGYPVTRRMARMDHQAWGKLVRRIAGLASRGVPLWGGGPVTARVAALQAKRSQVAQWLEAHSVFRCPPLPGAPGCWNVLDQEAEVVSILDSTSDSWRRWNSVELSAALDAKVYMGCQLLRDSDAASMAHSLEMRVPFIDIEVVKVAMACPSEHKLALDGGSGTEYALSGSKAVLIRALREVVSDEVLTRPKRGFVLPYMAWARSSLAEVMRETTNPTTLRRRGLVDPERVRSLLGQWGPWHRHAYPHLWSLMILELWCRTVLDRGRQPPESVECGDRPTQAPDRGASTPDRGGSWA